MTQPKDTSSATEYLCLSAGTKRVCVGWNGCDASFLISVEDYTVALGPDNQIPMNGSVIGKTDVEVRMTISPVQARHFAQWILDNIPTS